MISLIRSAAGARPTLFRVLCVAAVIAMAPSAHVATRAAGSPAVTPNYELASQWTVSKINKIVFDTAVTPHWFETSDRFWYSYETRDGKRYFLVDPLKKGKAPLFDNAKMAAMLTAATLVPMDSQHLPIKSLKVIKNDSALRLEVEVPKGAEIPGIKKPAARPTTTSSDKQDKADGQPASSGNDDSDDN